jgi:hypothetical protein
MTRIFVGIPRGIQTNISNCTHNFVFIVKDFNTTSHHTLVIKNAFNKSKSLVFWGGGGEIRSMNMCNAISGKESIQTKF